MGEIKKKNDLLMELLIEITKNPATAGRDRTNVETLITIHVHQCDVFDFLTKERNVRSVNDFDWLKQTRFYWNVD